MCLSFQGSLKAIKRGFMTLQLEENFSAPPPPPRTDEGRNSPTKKCRIKETLFNVKHDNFFNNHFLLAAGMVTMLTNEEYIKLPEEKVCF